MKFFHDPSFPGLGDVHTAHLSSDGEMLAATTHFRLLTEPKARASYGGHALRSRLCLYKKGQSVPAQVFDKMNYPIQAVAFHEIHPVLAIGGGRYDGGHFFEGELALWNWETNETRYIALNEGFTNIPEIVHLKINGDQLTIHMLPWDESWCEETWPDLDPFEICFNVTAKLSENGMDVLNIPYVKAALETSPPLPYERKKHRNDDTLTAFFETAEVRRRSPVWDMAWLEPNILGFVHDDTALDCLDIATGELTSYQSKGYGCEVMAGDTPLVHVTEQSYDSASKLYRFKAGGLEHVISFDGRYTFSRSSHGSILARGRNGQDRFISAEGDVKELSLGQYDVFNHYLRVDDAPYLFYIQNQNERLDHFSTPPNYAKWLCGLKPNGKRVKFWPILPFDGTNASHAMECTFAYIADELGEGIIIAGQHYDPHSVVNPYEGFILRRNLNAPEDVWRHKTKASATIIRALPEQNRVVAYFLNGEEWLIDTQSGHLIRKRAFKADSLDSIVFSCAVNEDKIAIGTIDGRVGVSPIDAFLST